jgi:hypothetical protein
MQKKVSFEEVKIPASSIKNLSNNCGKKSAIGYQKAFGAYILNLGSI